MTTINIKFTTNANCLGEYSESVLGQVSAKTLRGARAAKSRACREFQNWKMSPNYPFKTWVQLTDGTWDTLYCWMTLEDLFENPDLMEPGGIDHYKDELDRFGNFS